jgi:hypothetical protein
MHGKGGSFVIGAVTLFSTVFDHVKDQRFRSMSALAGTSAVRDADITKRGQS